MTKAELKRSLKDQEEANEDLRERLQTEFDWRMIYGYALDAACARLHGELRAGFIQDAKHKRGMVSEEERETFREEGRQEVRQEVRLVLSLSELGEEQPALPDWAEKMLCAEVAKDRYGEGTAPACGEERATDA